MAEECVELKNIKYQTMLLNKNSSDKPAARDNISDMSEFLKREQVRDKHLPWTKLEKATKLKKLAAFAATFPAKYNPTLKEYLFQCLERKKIQRKKDVNYSISEGKIKSINGLTLNKAKGRYTLKRAGKGSTLKCLAPKRPRKQRKAKTAKAGKAQNKKDRAKLN